MAIHKVGKHLMNVHMRDIDGVMRQFPPFGRGVMDIQAIIKALRQVDFHGFASIKQDQHPGRVLGYCYVDPGCGREALEEIRRCGEERGRQCVGGANHAFRWARWEICRYQRQILRNSNPASMAARARR